MLEIIFPGFQQEKFFLFGKNQMYEKGYERKRGILKIYPNLRYIVCNKEDKLQTNFSAFYVDPNELY